MRGDDVVIEVKVIPRASREKVLLIAPNRYKVYLTEPALEGKANQALIELMSEHFKVRKTSIKIIRGEKSRSKWMEIHD